MKLNLPFSKSQFPVPKEFPDLDTYSRMIAGNRQIKEITIDLEKEYIRYTFKAKDI